ncbi:MAG: S-adenosylmethionine decarboxylase [Labilibaculum sp.]|nr:S-adenosylmethionine decarboxylase [Labilibaculum sp.]
METKAKILSAKIHNLRFWVSEYEPKDLQAQFQDFLEQVGFVILNFTDYHFPVQGYTAFWLLAESHLAIHTFPDKGWSYIELSSCNKKKSEDFQSLVIASDMSVKWNGDGVEICEPE